VGEGQKVVGQLVARVLEKHKGCFIQYSASIRAALCIGQASALSERASAERDWSAAQGHAHGRRAGRAVLAGGARARAFESQGDHPLTAPCPPPQTMPVTEPFWAMNAAPPGQLFPAGS